MANEKYSATSWATTPVHDLKMPSGQLCQVKMLDMEDLVELDIVDQVDELGLVVSDHEEAAKGKPMDRQKKKPTKKEAAAAQDKAAKEVMRDKKRFKVMAQVADKVVAHCVLQPKIVLHVTEDADGELIPIPYDERDPSLVYTDAIPFNDKMFIFDDVFEGTEDLKSFRDGSEPVVESVEA